MTLTHARNAVSALLLSLALIAVAVRATQEPKASGSQGPRETDSELQWVRRFANCDYGFFVLLPDGYVAHSNLPPSPIHGFLISLPDTSTTKPASTDNERLVWVNAEYNSLEWKSLNEAADYAVDLMAKGKSGFKVADRKPAQLNGHAAAKVKAEYDTPNGRVVEEEIITLRSGIIYEIGLRTIAANYESDKRKFIQIVNGFRFWRIHHC
jgi:hypothetical protein